MEERSEPEEKFCGNCRNHTVYQYPDFIFCFVRYQHHKDSVVPTLWCCEEWERKPQECFCVEEALKKKCS